VEYRLRSFVPWLASISLDVAMEDDVVQDPAHVVFIMVSKNSYNTKPTVILHFSTPCVFWLWPTVENSFMGKTGKYTRICPF
jgi:hypothetical protein